MSHVNQSSHASHVNALPEVPESVVDGEGAARFGTYRGALGQVVLPRAGRLTRLASHKRWLYTFVATREVIALYAIVDLGYASNAFVLVADRASKSVLFDRGFTGLPRPFVRVSDFPAGAPANAPTSQRGASFRLPGVRLGASFSSGADEYHQRAQVDDLLWLGELSAAKGPPAITVIAPVSEDGRRVNVTQKWAALRSRGMLEVGGRSFDLNGGVGGIDYTNGYLARRTAWRWAFACGTLPTGERVGLNLVSGFNDAPGVSENALFIGSELVPLGRARFTWNRDDVLAPWRLTTEEGADGAVDLGFQPFGAHRERRNLGIVRSHFVQPVGHFSGTLRALGRSYAIEDLAGVTEDQDILW
ncbi:DUF2804 domain-containing protein [Pendulispora albinea]|uniref:DUF2804 domain-containing protein n=1 Tax=Pendulispora albinea TaxID=2741071 RepID=A0ABZ2M8S8_9BACT